MVTISYAACAVYVCVVLHVFSSLLLAATHRRAVAVVDVDMTIVVRWSV